MSDFGTPEERAAALKVAELCKALNAAIFDALHDHGVNCKIADIQEDWDRMSILQIQRMERRIMILPSPITEDARHDV